MTVANTILEQLGGRRFIAMTGAKDFLGDKDLLAFRLPRGARGGINKVRITLTPADLYDVQFYKMGSKSFTLLAQADNVDAAQLRQVFTRHTGLETSLGTLGNPSAVRGKRKRPGKPQTYQYIVDLDERGAYAFHVNDESDREVFSARAEGEPLWLVEDGYMRHTRDMAGLLEYLVQMGVVAQGSRLDYMG